MEITYIETKFWYCPLENSTYSEQDLEDLDKDIVEDFAETLIPCTVEMWLELNTEEGRTYIDNIEYKNLEIRLDKTKILKSFIQTFDKKTLDNLIDEAIFQYERE